MAVRRSTRGLSRDSRRLRPAAHRAGHVRGRRRHRLQPVDAKPKRGTGLKRLANVAANPAVALLVDHYADDWNELWWVRADGTGRVVDPKDPEGVRALSLLADRYPRFAARGAVLAVDVRRWSGWAASAATEEG